MTRIVVVTLGLAVLTGWAGRAEACSCRRASEVCGAASDYWRTATVFLGRVEAIERPAAKRVPRYLGSRRVRLRVLEAFRGAPTPGAEVFVLTGGGGGDCGYPFKDGQDYLVYASRGEDDELSTNICTRTRPAARAAADLDYLRTAAAGRAPSGRVIGEVSVEAPDRSPSRRSSRPAPLAGITVLLTQNGATLRAQTDVNGRYAIEGPAVGRYVLGAELPEKYYAFQTGQTIEVPDTRACVEADVTVRYDGRVTGRIIDGRGRGVPGLTVDLTIAARLDEPGGLFGVRTVTRSDGTFELTRVPPDTFFLGIHTERSRKSDAEIPRVFYPGVEDPAAARKVVMPGGGRIALDDFVLPSHVEYVRVEGMVLAPDGAPAPGARVFLKQDSERSYIMSEPAIADASGRFVLAALAGSSWRVFAERSGDADGKWHVESSDPVAIIPDGRSPPLRLQLRRRY